VTNVVENNASKGLISTSSSTPTLAALSIRGKLLHSIAWLGCGSSSP
jgi:hypothetical protein